MSAALSQIATPPQRISLLYSTYNNVLDLIDKSLRRSSLDGNRSKKQYTCSDGMFEGRFAFAFKSTWLAEAAMFYSSCLAHSKLQRNHNYAWPFFGAGNWDKTVFHLLSIHAPRRQILPCTPVVKTDASTQFSASPYMNIKSFSLHPVPSWKPTAEVGTFCRALLNQWQRCKLQTTWRNSQKSAHGKASRLLRSNLNMEFSSIQPRVCKRGLLFTM